MKAAKKLRSSICPLQKKKEKKRKDYVKDLNGYFPKTDGQEIFGKVMGITKMPIVR